MNITTKIVKSANGEGKRGNVLVPYARISCVVMDDETVMGSTTILSGPEQEIDLYMAGTMTLAQVKEAWGFAK
jgi:hypothetical protein